MEQCSSCQERETDRRLQVMAKMRAGEMHERKYWYRASYQMEDLEQEANAFDDFFFFCELRLFLY